MDGPPARSTETTALIRDSERTRSSKDKLERHSQKIPRARMELDWEEAEAEADKSDVGVCPSVSTLRRLNQRQGYGVRGKAIDPRSVLYPSPDPPPANSNAARRRLCPSVSLCLSVCLSMSMCLFVYVRARETGRYDCITRNHLRYSDSIAATRSPADEASIAFQLDYCNAVTPCTLQRVVETTIPAARTRYSRRSLVTPKHAVVDRNPAIS